MFGIVEIETTFHGCRFAIGIRNAHDKSMRLAMTVGYRVLVCDNMAFSGDFTPVLAKHSKHFNLIHSLEIGVSEMQRNFEPMTHQVNRWRESQLTDVTAKLIIYQAFIEAERIFRNTSPGRCISCISIRSTRSSRRARCGVFRTRSPRR